MITISKRTVITTLKHFFVWLLVSGIVNAIFGRLFQPESVGAFIWELLNVGSFILFVIVPAVRVHKEEKEQFAKDQELLNSSFRVLNQNTELERPATVAPETIAVRNKYLADINSCLSGTQYCWRWATKSSVNTLFIYCPEIRAENGVGTLVVVNGRVEQISYERHDGIVKTFLNQALIEARREESLRVDAPVVKFMEGAIPDARWFWVNAEAKTICVSSKQKGFTNCTAILKYHEDGHISSINVEIAPGQFKRVFAKKGQVATEEPLHSNAVPAGTSAHAKKKRAPRADIKGRTDTSATRCTIVAPEDTTPPIDVVLPETEANLLKPTDTPPVDDDRLKQAAMLIADDDALELNDLAMAAEENGDTSFVKKWTEGLQTMKEVEYYCDAILKSGVFSRVDINAENQTIRFYLHSAENY